MSKRVPYPKDRLGNDLVDGDEVLSFNVFAAGELYEDIKNDYSKKIGVPAIFRIIDDWMWVYLKSPEMGSTGCDPSDPRFGVEKSSGALHPRGSQIREASTEAVDGGSMEKS